MVAVTVQRSKREVPRPWLALGRRVAALRAPMSQAELARRAGIHKGYVGRIERGLNCPKPPVLRDIAAALGGGRAVYNELAHLAGYQLDAEPEETFPEQVQRVLLQVDRLLRSIVPSEPEHPDSADSERAKHIPEGKAGEDTGEIPQAEKPVSDSERPSCG